MTAGRSAAELERQASLQEEQLGTIRLQLAQVQATLQRLRTQRDILQARLKVALARASVDRGGFASKATRRRRLIVRVGAAIGLMLLAVILVFNFPALASSRLGTAVVSWLGGPLPEAPASAGRAETGETLKTAWSRTSTLSADGRTMVLCEASPQGSQLRVWDLHTGREQRKLEPSHAPPPGRRACLRTAGGS